MQLRARRVVLLDVDHVSLLRLNDREVMDVGQLGRVARVADRQLQPAGDLEARRRASLHVGKIGRCGPEGFAGGYRAGGESERDSKRD